MCILPICTIFFFELYVVGKQTSHPTSEHLAWDPGRVISPSSLHREGAFSPLPSETWPELTLLWHKPITLVFLSHVDSLEFSLSNF